MCSTQQTVNVKSVLKLVFQSADLQLKIITGRPVPTAEDIEGMCSVFSGGIWGF